MFQVYTIIFGSVKYSYFKGRITLLLTSFLVLVNIFNAVLESAPKSDGLTALEIWVICCIINVFGVLAEYALLLKMILTNKTRKAKENLQSLMDLDLKTYPKITKVNEKLTLEQNQLINIG